MGNPQDPRALEALRISVPAHFARQLDFLGPEAGPDLLDALLQRLHGCLQVRVALEDLVELEKEAPILLPVLL